MGVKWQSSNSTALRLVAGRRRYWIAENASVIGPRAPQGRYQYLVPVRCCAADNEWIEFGTRSQIQDNSDPAHRSCFSSHHRRELRDRPQRRAARCTIGANSLIGLWRGSCSTVLRTSGRKLPGRRRRLGDRRARNFPTIRLIVGCHGAGGPHARRQGEGRDCPRSPTSTCGAGRQYANGLKQIG